MKEFIRVMKALSDPGRVAILKILQQRMLCVGELQSALHFAQPTVSKHLKIPEDAGLVNREKDGLRVNCSIADGSKSPYAACLLGQLRHWLAEDRNVCELQKIAALLNRHNLCVERCFLR